MKGRKFIGQGCPTIIAGCLIAASLAACSLTERPVVQLGTPPFPPPLQPPKPGGSPPANDMSVASTPEDSLSTIEVSELTQASEREDPSSRSDGNSYEVQEGDTLFSISNATKTRLTELVDLNDLEPPYRLSAGQTLRLPARSGRTEEEQPAETAEEASEDDSTVAASPQVPSDDREDKTEEDNSSSTESETPDMSEPESEDIPVAAETGPISDPPPLTGNGFSWPLQGDILSRYGAQKDGQHNDGINIAASEGTIVRASENGVVVYAGNELRGFGNLLLVRHQDGWVTAYGHNSRLLVGRGAEVERGQPIAEAGNSGSVSRPQLHFEIRKGTRALDPLELLKE